MNNKPLDGSRFLGLAGALFCSGAQIKLPAIRRLIQLGMECNIAEGRSLLGKGRLGRRRGQGEGKEDLNYNSWPPSSNESLANEVGARLTQTISCTTAENLTSTPFNRLDRDVTR